MSNLRITDNHEFINLNSPSDPRYWHDQINDNVKRDLMLISDVKIGELKLKDNSNLLVFPRDLHKNGDEIGENNIISIKNDEISTGNIMGFIGINETQLDIRSRFADIDKEDSLLHYLLRKVFAINLFDIKHTTSKVPIFDFLLYMFPYFLKKALAQGLYKKYQKYEHNDANIKGPINISRHIQQNIPFKGTVAYSTREYSYDNDVTQLIRHTIEYIKTKPTGQIILNNDRDTKECVSQISLATQQYNHRERQHVVNKNLRSIRHPYYSAYTELQKLCIQILRHESIKYGHEKDKVYGILFDGAWLWEEYLDKVFKENGLSITHAKNKTGENGISLYVGGKKCYYPDFYLDNKNFKDGSQSFVLDAKYKRLGYDVKTDEQDDSSLHNEISIGRDDLFQMITYMHVMPAQHCALLYPIERHKNANANNVVEARARYLNGFGGDILGYGLRISDNLNDFYQEMAVVEKDLCNAVRTWLK